MAGEVRVSYQGRHHNIDIEDVTSADLQDLFGMEVRPAVSIPRHSNILVKV